MELDNLKIEIQYANYLHSDIIELASNEIQKFEYGEELEILSSSKVITMFKNDLIPISIIIFREWKDNSEIWIDCSYTLPKYRKLGYYNMLYDRLLKYSKNTGISKISSGVSNNNKNMLKIINKNKDRTVDFIVFSHEL